MKTRNKKSTQKHQNLSQKKLILKRNDKENNVREPPSKKVESKHLLNKMDESFTNETTPSSKIQPL